MENGVIQDYALPPKGGINGQYPIKRSSPGFSFVELLITLAIFSILVGAIFGFFTSQRDVYLVEELKLERDQNLQIALDTISRELTEAGYRAVDDVFIRQMPRWVPSNYIPSDPLAVILDANPKISLGAGNLPDVITFAGGVSTANNPTTLSEDSNGTSLKVSLSNSDSQKQYKPGDIVTVGYLPEYASVVAVSGNTLTVDTDLAVSGLQPFQAVHPSGSILEEISIVSYTVFNDANDSKFQRHKAGQPLLKRKINAGGFYPVAENISQIKAGVLQDGVVQVFLTGRLNQGRLMGGGLGEKTVATRISLRNSLQAGVASGCIKPAVPSGLVLDDGLNKSFPCQIRLYWDPVSVNASGISLSEAGCPLTGYRIFYDEVPGAFGNHVDVSVGDASGYTLDVSGIPAGAIYVSVAAQNSGGFGEKAPEMVISDNTPPGKAEGLNAIIAGPQAIVLSWNKNSECDLGGYYLYRKKDSGTFALAAGMISAGSSGYTDTGLVSGASYSYRIGAVDYGFNGGALSDVVTVTMP